MNFSVQLVSSDQCFHCLVQSGVSCKAIPGVPGT